MMQNLRLALKLSFLKMKKVYTTRDGGYVDGGYVDGGYVDGGYVDGGYVDGDCEDFLANVLVEEKQLTKKTKEQRDGLAQAFGRLRSRYPENFTSKGPPEDESEELYNDLDIPTESPWEALDVVEVKDVHVEAAPQFPPVPASELTNVLMFGFLDKKRKEHSFFSGEWQRRWCVISRNIFYYYGDKKDKQQKGAFSLDGYDVIMMTNVTRKEKKDCCFELSAPEKRTFQFATAKPEEAIQWTSLIHRAMHSSVDDFECEYGDIDMDDPNDDIYEMLPDDVIEEFDLPSPTSPKPEIPAETPTTKSGTQDDFNNFYQGLWDCKGEKDDELTFKRGEMIYIVSKDFDSDRWWVGNLNGTIGLVPKDYLMQAYEL
uniref:src kinase-associated phosphoprotein 2-A-like n=1 Tax=Myxine glutinosa TaxID=7769 RepID=UPI00358F8EAD